MRTLRIGFTENGIDEAMLSYAIANFQADALVLLVSNGTISAENHIAEFIANLPVEMRGLKSVTVVSPPLYALSVESVDSTLSKPHYVWTDVARDRWFVQNIVAPAVDLHVTRSPGKKDPRAEVTVKLSDKAKIDILNHVVQAWRSVSVIESFTCFPASCIAIMIDNYDVFFVKNPDLSLIRKLTGIDSFDYNPTTKVFSITVAGDLFTISAELMKFALSTSKIMAVTGKIARYRFSIDVCGDAVFENVNFGVLGYVVSQFNKRLHQSVVCNDSPISSPEIFQAYARRVRANSENSRIVPTGI